MQVREVMGPAVGSVAADDLLRDASATMKALGIDPLPVIDNGKVVGMLSERSLMDRVQQDGPSGGLVQVRDVMSSELVCCYADQDVTEAVQNLSSNPVAVSADRVPVLDREGTLVGVASLRNLQQHDPNADDGTAAVQSVETVDEMVQYEDDRVEYMSDQSFPASDPPSSQAAATPAPTEDSGSPS